MSVNRKHHTRHVKALLLLIVISAATCDLFAQDTPKEDDYFKIVPVMSPQTAILEVGGLTMLPNGHLGVATRRGDLYIVENPTTDKPYFRKFASGLHEVLGLVYKDGSFYCVQR